MLQNNMKIYHQNPLKAFNRTGVNCKLYPSQIMHVKWKMSVI